MKSRPYIVDDVDYGSLEAIIEEAQRRNPKIDRKLVIGRWHAGWCTWRRLAGPRLSRTQVAKSAKRIRVGKAPINWGAA